MATYKTFEIQFETVLYNGDAKAKVYFSDSETEYEDEIEYKLDINDIDKFGGAYIDNVAEKLLNEAISKLIEQKKEYRKSILNIYDEEVN